MAGLPTQPLRMLALLPTWVAGRVYAMLAARIGLDSTTGDSYRRQAGCCIALFHTAL